MKKVAVVFIFLLFLVFFIFFIRAETTFFDVQDDFFIMGEISEGGTIHSGSGGGSSGSKMLFGIPEGTEQKKDKEDREESSGGEEEKPEDGNPFRDQLIFLALFFPAVFFILRVQRMIFRLIRL